MSVNRSSLLGLVPIVAIVGAFWFVLLGPTRAEVSATRAQVQQAGARRDAAVAAAAEADRTRRRYPRDYASVARLARAVPADEGVAALVRGLDAVARANRIDFRTIALSDAVPKDPAPAPAADAAGGGTDKAGGGAAAPAGTDTTAGASGADATAQPPAGAAVGAAGLLTMPFTFTAEGDYMTMQRFLKALHAGASHAHGRVEVNGRLLTIDGFAFTAGREGFPQISAVISATAYLEPDPGGVIARSTPRAPALGSAVAAAPAPPPVQGAAG